MLAFSQVEKEIAGMIDSGSRTLIGRLVIPVAV